MSQGCLSAWRNREAAPAHEAKEEKMKKEKINGKRGGVFRGKYVREIISGRKGAVEIGSRVCTGAGRFVMIVFRQSMQRFDLVEVK
jgi:hypothetical protein